ncbi:MAG: FeoB-associated Cys-rich membrane protein [Gelidibacter sp.]|nr:FeoB-associated Cys-rich membrane protein [Gelidibacter sp.]
MNTLLQNILVFTALAFAVWFLVRKFLLKKAKTDKGCGTGDDCGCH